MDGGAVEGETGSSDGGVGEKQDKHGWMMYED